MNNRKFLPVTAAILLILPFVLFAGGTNEEEFSPAPARAAERAERIERIVSLAPGITETIFALGAGDRLAGRTDFCDYPAQVFEVPSVGTIQQPNIEVIISLKPDLVIASTHAPRDIVEPLESSGIKVEYLYAPESFDGVCEIIESIGRIVGKETAAAELTTDIKKRYDRIRENVDADFRRPEVYYVIGFGEGGDWTAGGDTFIGQMIETAGGKNIAADISGWSFSLEKLVESDPEIILISSGMKDSFVNTPIYSELGAVKSGRVFGIDEDLLDRQGPRLIDGVEAMNKIFMSGSGG